MSVAARKWANNNSEWVATCVDRALEEYARRPDIPTLLPSLSREYPEAFFASAVKHLEAEPSATVQELLGGLLARQESLLELIADPASCSRASAVRVFRILLAIDPTLDFKLARMLPGRNDATQTRVLSESHAARAIEILDEASPDQRLLSVIGPLINSLNPKISSKAILFAGRRRANNPAWLSTQLGREDNRLRATVLESVWGVHSGVALRLLEECTLDANNRVAGNALVGLHLAKHPEVATKALEMSNADDPARRSSAAWAMGKIGSACFTGRLTEMLRDSDARVRSTALRSLARIRRAGVDEVNQAQAAPVAAVEPAAP